MSTIQAITEKVTELTKLALGFVAQAAASLVNTAEKLPLEEIDRRLDGALRVLRGEAVPPSAVLTDAPKASLQIAQYMVDCYVFHKDTGVSTFTVPAGVTDVEAMKALNEYFRKNCSLLQRDAVRAEHFEWYERLPREYPELCPGRDYSGARQISITVLVKGTNGQSRTTQDGILKSKFFVFSDPRDQALAGTIHACKHNGEDLFRGNWVRGSVPGLVVGTNNYNGVYLRITLDESDSFNVAASGSHPRI